MREISPPDFGWKNVPYFIDGIEVGVPMILDPN
jgi:hypothetical protein